MEAARKTIKELGQRILPERPHHLAFHPEWRFRPGPGDGNAFEEWNHPRLQYLTLLSDSDRGILLTKSDYDMREEPAKPLPREVNALAKGGEKKKLSLSDYKNKKTGATSSTSPPEPSIARKKESERAGELAATNSNNSNTTTRLAREPAADMRLPLKPPTKHPLPPRPPSPVPKKRVADLDDDSRPHKRSRPEGGKYADDRASLSRDDAQRRKDRAPAMASRDAPQHRDDRPPAPVANSSSLPNGRALLKSAMGSSRNNTSPAHRPRGDSMNGVRPPGSGSNRVTPTKSEAQKASVPPLLSPLHLTFDDRDAEERSLAKQNKKRSLEESQAQPKSPSRQHKKSESTSELKRPQSPLRLPPLLSPTLPPVVEAALQLRKKKSLELAEGKPAKSKDDKEKEPPSKKKRPAANDLSDADDDDEPLFQRPRKSLVVTLKVPKKLRRDFKRILALSSSTAARKELQAQNQERSAPPEDSFQPPPARKRPVAPGDASGTRETSTSQKKPRVPDIPSSSRLPAPTTPSKRGATSMSRVSSSNSLAQTPGDNTVNATPSAPASSDRRVNGQAMNHPESVEARAMRDKEARLSTLGRRLKHEADTAMRGGAGGNEPDLKRGYAISVESLLAFMAGFQAQNMYRGLCNKRSDPSGWSSLFPLLEFIEGQMKRQEAHTRRFLPLFVLVLNIHLLAITELIRCHVTVENAAVTVTDFTRLERMRFRLWSQLSEALNNIEDPALRLEIPQYQPLDDGLSAIHRMLIDWCHHEDVDWTPDAKLEESLVSRG
ncbi:uncharacterized protein TRIREDRAFT_21249 [Trichoderma reesei QM6a]|uniref:Predicted protein n=2 Tax=Hypocrea jecorina TaxID=51453 RepID=G0R895_HYPJQ|nr:uncharacterized protein TRIREDRAFT_21249 [Trichoderma reesei QM6a]EGR52838.1 predicted protein [Trichoderma reesei QM6a]ETS06592.1 hypothetical protein M419DRAFT_135427 [Trichoderma reesei RUT C-30]